jgi:hypothetical protein
MTFCYSKQIHCTEPGDQLCMWSVPRRGGAFLFRNPWKQYLPFLPFPRPKLSDAKCNLLASYKTELAKMILSLIFPFVQILFQVLSILHYFFEASNFHTFILFSKSSEVSIAPFELSPQRFHVSFLFRLGQSKLMSLDNPNWCPWTILTDVLENVQWIPIFSFLTSQHPQNKRATHFKMSTYMGNSLSSLTPTNIKKTVTITVQQQKLMWGKMIKMLVFIFKWTYG